MIASPQINAVAYEMGTIGRSAPRRAWHAQQLVALARNVHRSLTLVIRAGWSHLAELSSAFERVIMLDTTAHMKAKMRQSAVRTGCRLTWKSTPTAAGEAIDQLLRHNIRDSRRATRELLSSPPASDLTITANRRPEATRGTAATRSARRQPTSTGP